MVMVILHTPLLSSGVWLDYSIGNSFHIHTTYLHVVHRFILHYHYIKDMICRHETSSTVNPPVQ